MNLESIRTYGAYVVSSDTLRLEDLIPMALECLESIAPEQARMFRDQNDDVLSDLENADPQFVSEAYDELLDTINQCLPEDIWFGHNDDHPTDVGFWLVRADD